MFVCGEGEGVGVFYVLKDYITEETSLIALHQMVRIITFHWTRLVHIIQVSNSGPLWQFCLLN